MNAESSHYSAGRSTRSAYERWLKPAIDRLAAGLILVLAAPVLALVAIAIRVTLGSPVIFRQTRVGRNGVEFTVYKFRSMRPDRRLSPVTAPPAEERRLNHKSPHDPRLTPLGRFLRGTSLDEFPQLVNVLRGEMSLVGPRPELPSIVARYARATCRARRWCVRLRW